MPLLDVVLNELKDLALAGEETRMVARRPPRKVFHCASGVLLVAGKSFRRLDHAALLAKVAEGARCAGGVRVVEEVNNDAQEAVA